MAQLIGAAIATALFGWLFKDDGERFNSDPTGTPAGPPSDTERSAPIADQRPRQADALS
jgi:hypothetical protein